MNKLNALAYKHAFEAIFTKVKGDFPEFEVGKTLNGIIADWSDTQLQGLQEAIGEKKANKVVKGCQVCIYVQKSKKCITLHLQVHYQRSVKRVSEKVNKGSSTLAHQVFTTIGYAIPATKTKEDVDTLFQVLCGAESLSCAIKILPESKSLFEKYQSEHDADTWTKCTHWCEWWTRPNHLSKSDYFEHTF